MVTYRGFVKLDNVRQTTDRFTLTAKRRSAKADAYAREVFTQFLGGHCGIGRNAHAWLERSDRSGLEILERCTPETTEWRTLPDGYCKQPSRCHWKTADGRIIAATR